MADVRFWLIQHNPDLNETGYLRNRTYLKTTWEGHKMQRACELEMVRDWCHERFGNEVAYVQGCAVTLNWKFHEITEREYEIAEPNVVSNFKAPTRRVEIGIGNHGKTVVYSDTDASERRMSLQECQKKAAEIGFNSATFDIVGRGWKQKAKWLDAHFGYFTVDGMDGFMRVGDMLPQFGATGFYCENLKAGE